MSTKICDVNPEAESKLPENMGDKSGIGVHYIDALIKPMNTTLADGTAISVKRKGGKLTVTYGDKKGEALCRRFDNGPDVKTIVRKAMEELFGSIGMTYAVENNAIVVDAKA